MGLRRFDDAAAFSRHVAGYLLAHEEEHNLLLGLRARLAVDPLSYRTPPYLAAVEANGAVIAVALMTPPHPLQLSRAEDMAALSASTSGTASTSRRRPPSVVLCDDLVYDNLQKH